MKKLHKARIDLEGRGEFVVYRFPYSPEVISRIKSEIKAVNRSWIPTAKAWAARLGDPSDTLDDILDEEFPLLDDCINCAPPYPYGAKRHSECGAWKLAEDSLIFEKFIWGNNTKPGLDDNPFWGEGPDERWASRDDNYYKPPPPPPPAHDEKISIFAKSLMALGLTSKPTKDELKTAFRKMAVLHHPDRGGSHEKMAELNNAREYLEKLL